MKKVLSLKFYFYIFVLIKFFSSELQLPKAIIDNNSFRPATQSCDQTFNENFNSLVQIGQGFFGEVRKYLNNKVIKKVCNNKKRQQEIFLQEKDKEIYFLKKIYNEAITQNLAQNFIKFYNCYQDQDGCFYLEMEKKGGNFGYKLNSNNTSYKFLEIFSFLERQKIYINFLKALNMIHSLSLVHCDIKPDNLFISIDLDNYQKNLNIDLPYISIGDFGLIHQINQNIVITNRLFNHPIVLQLLDQDAIIPAIQNFDIYSAILSIFAIENYKKDENDMNYFTLNNIQFKQKLSKRKGQSSVYQKYFDLVKEEIQVFLQQIQENILPKNQQYLESCDNFYCILYLSLTEDINQTPTLNTIIENLEKVLNSQQNNAIQSGELQNIEQIPVEKKIQEQNINQHNDIQHEKQKIEVKNSLSQTFYINEPRIIPPDQTYNILIEQTLYKFQEEESILVQSLFYDLKDVQKNDQFVLEIQKNYYFNIQEKLTALKIFNQYDLQEYFLYDEFPEMKQQTNDRLYCFYRYKINFMFIEKGYFTEQQDILTLNDQAYFQQFQKLFKGINELHKINLVHLQISPLTIVQVVNKNNLNLKFTNLGFYQKNTDFKKEKSIRYIQQFVHYDIQTNVKKNDFIISEKYDIYSLSLSCLLIFMNVGINQLQRIIPNQINQNYETQIVNNILDFLNFNTIDFNTQIKDCNFTDSKLQFICIMISCIKRQISIIPSSENLTQKMVLI